MTNYREGVSGKTILRLPKKYLRLLFKLKFLVTSYTVKIKLSRIMCSGHNLSMKKFPKMQQLKKNLYWT